MGELAALGAHTHPAGMFVVTEAEAAAIRAVYEQSGELSAAVELRRLFPGVSDNAEARRYLGLAARYLRPRACRLVAIGGLSGTGKSTLAAALAPSLDARVLRSDVIRKHLFGVAPETRLPARTYTPEASHRVYEALRRKAADAVRTSAYNKSLPRRCPPGKNGPRRCGTG